MSNPSLTEIKKFDHEKLKHVDTKEENTLPTTATLFSELRPDELPSKPELELIKKFVSGRLRHVETAEKVILPSVDDVRKEKFVHEIRVFDPDTLKHTDTKVSEQLPTLNELRAELVPDHLPTRPELAKLQEFAKSYLRHVDLVEKNVLPSKKDIEEESANTMAEVKSFSRSQLKHSEVCEKNPLPDMATLWSELLPDEFLSKPELEELRKFVHTNLNHVESNIKLHLPTKQEIEEERTATHADVKTFDRKQLKKVVTEEKTLLPTSADLRAELLPDYLPSKQEISVLGSIIKSALKHVETQEKRWNPTAEDLKQDKCSSCCVSQQHK